MSKFSSFLSHLAPELRLIARGFSAVASNFLDAQAKADVEDVVTRMGVAADNIENSIKSVLEATSAQPSAAQLKKAVKEAMPELIAEAVAKALEEHRSGESARIDAAVARALEAITNPNKV